MNWYFTCKKVDIFKEGKIYINEYDNTINTKEETPTITNKTRQGTSRGMNNVEEKAHTNTRTDTKDDTKKQVRTKKEKNNN